MKFAIEFNLPEEEKEAVECIRGSYFKMKIDSLYDEVFRPSFKHDAPIVGDTLTEEQRDFLFQVWTLVNDHFSEGL